ncbi:MAG: shikimate kinase [Hyphomicrobiaceae bacterium]
MAGSGIKRNAATQQTAAKLVERLGQRSIVLVGLMGCGKSSVGRRLAVKLGLPFVDADTEIELAAGKTIPEIFTDYGEEHFRDREHLVIARLLRGGPQVLATGGGAYMRADTRLAIAKAGIAVWLRAELDVLMRRVMRRDDRPMLKNADPEATMRQLMDVRYPIYAEADLTIESRDVTHEVVVNEIVTALKRGPLAET